jgi:hypothetical protein
MLVAVGIVLCLFASGCSGGGPGRVDAPLARQSLQTVLESWKNGDQPRALQDRSPKIVVQDVDWEAGRALVDFEIVGAGKFDDANLRCPVALTLKEKSGRKVKKQVRYVVGTSPAITVFREFF